MKRKPRNTGAGIFSGGLGYDVAYQGVMVAALVMVSYFIGAFIEYESLAIMQSSHGITMAFLTMSMAEIFHSMNMRSQRGSIFALRSTNKMLLIAALASFLATTAVCEIPFLASAFGFTGVGIGEYLIAIGLGFTVIPIVEIVKLCQRAWTRRKA